MLLAALDAAIKLAGRDGVNYQGRSQWDDVSWLRTQAELVAAGGPAANGSAGTRWRLEVPDSASIVSTRQAAAILRCSPRAVVAAIERGDLTATRVGRRTWALAEVDVRRFAGQNGRRPDASQQPGGGDRHADHD
jgi:excisionase family DNA binding protein